MISKELEQILVATWMSYSQALNEKFNIKGFLEAQPVIDVLQTGNVEKVQEFIEYVKTKTDEILNLD